MIRFLIQNPHVLYTVGLIIACSVFWLGYKLGRRHGRQDSDKRNAELLRERERIASKCITDLIQERDRLAGTKSYTFTGNIGDPAVLAAAFNTVEKLQREAEASPDAETSGNGHQRKITPEGL